MAVPQIIEELVKRFEYNREAYRSSNYNEAQLRREFLDPFFEALGWDVQNKQGYAEAYKDVIHEDSIRIGGGTKAPDYCFRIGGARKFFLEAKKPSVNIKSGMHPAYQLRRYAWSAKLPLSILTDFEEFAVYDCRLRPNKTDAAAKARVMYMTFQDYAERWQDIEEIFSQEAILKGSFDKYAEPAQKKRGTAEVDDEFLKEIELWRDVLAKNLALRNPDLTTRDLNFAVQRTIDRLIFLRICEDRKIEPYGRLGALRNGHNIYPRLCQIFREADQRYNSGLFHFNHEKNRTSAPDELSLQLDLDDKVLKDLLRRMYYPESPYEFSVLPADILGQVYERFLGKVIRLTPGHQAKIEEKPEVRKAGGVYYTPTYIVDYIVENTVGKLLNGDDPDIPKPVSLRKASDLRILDPACGSGSFLLGAYQYLLDWHRDRYVQDDPEKHARGKPPRLHKGRGGEWKLTTAERRRILLNNIYGVDIDPQAVEVTKLSLLLKVLEGETDESLDTQLKFFHERALPDLSNNIKCGNSLIGPDYYNAKQLELFDAEEHYRINAFDWEAEFPEILPEGNSSKGFDAVIGNPPYVDAKLLGTDIKNALSERYKAATRRFDLYIPFVERGLFLLKQKGLLAYIVPTMFVVREYGEDLRKTIVQEAAVVSIVDFGVNQVFKGAMNYTGIFVLRKGAAQENVDMTRCNDTDLSQIALRDVLMGAEVDGAPRIVIPASGIENGGEWRLWSIAETQIFEHVQIFPCLHEFLECASEGIHSGKDEVFFPHREMVRQMNLETPPVYPLAKGKDVHRYSYIKPMMLPYRVIYPYDLESGEVYSEEKLKVTFPNLFEYLVDSRHLLAGRSYFERSSKKWYELWCQRNPAIFTRPKIVGPEIAQTGEFTFFKDVLFVNNKLKVLLLKESTEFAAEYLVGLLNSSLLTFIHRRIAPPKGGGFFEVKTRILGRLPIRTIDFNNADDKAKHDRMVQLVEHMLELHRQLDAANSGHDKNMLQRQINHTDQQIDRLVYDLYGLNDEEIAIVENS